MNAAKTEDQRDHQEWAEPVELARAPDPAVDEEGRSRRSRVARVDSWDPFNLEPGDIDDH